MAEMPSIGLAGSEPIENPFNAAPIGIPARRWPIQAARENLGDVCRAGATWIRVFSRAKPKADSGVPL